MFVPRANQRVDTSIFFLHHAKTNFLFVHCSLQGALLGLAVSLAFSMWISFGQPKPPLPVLPFPTGNCTATGLPSHDAFKAAADVLDAADIEYAMHFC